VLHRLESALLPSMKIACVFDEICGRRKASGTEEDERKKTD
jgi:hypothetical protein